MADGQVIGQAQAVTKSLRLVVEWTPGTGQLAVAFPEVDDTIKLGMLEMAKQVLGEQRIRNGMGTQSPLAIPKGMVIPRA